LVGFFQRLANATSVRRVDDAIFPIFFPVQFVPIRLGVPNHPLAVSKEAAERRVSDGISPKSEW
jgi:hypothetical protein